ncbi:TPR-like protein [Dendrothele bispora CBS 962.96]|uniref:TPR-like protein n=1 Tax=Dendrothele bispora (strain CBS 962.96) TaxID=1314807 RepID=A0A4S8LKS9_DENBC|nr:TPR-like protein [Dendrothele bispora CBS 962.96]
MEHFEQFGDWTAVDNAVQLMEEVIKLTPDGHTEEAARLDALGDALRQRFECLGKLGDIENAILVHQQAVDLTPDGDAGKVAFLNHLANALIRRFEHLGKLSDIENAILLHQQTADLVPDGDSNKAAQLNHLGNAFLRRFERLGELKDIENTIFLHRQAVDLTPDGHAHKGRWLANLGNAFLRRFEHLGELGDIENAIFANQQAVDLTPDGHARKATRLNNLGNALFRRFQHLGKLGDIENAILLNQQAVNLTPDGHADKVALLNNLGNCFVFRFEHVHELEDIENAILANQQAVDLTPDSHAQKATWLTNLGNAFLSRFRHLGELRDIENSILVNRQAINLTPDGHTDKAAQLSNLGAAFRSRFEHLGELGDIMEAILAYKQAAENTSSNSLTRYTAACRWATLCSEHQSPSSALDAYTVVLEIIPQVVWFGQTVHRRYEELPNIGRTINAAAAMAISVGHLSRAVEWLEEGRSIVWKQILQLRTPLDELHQLYPDIADELSRVSLALDDAGTSNFQFIDSQIRHKSVEEEAQNHRKLATQYEELLQYIRKLDGFHSFLRPKKFSELAPAAMNGPVVIINVHDSGCGALVVCPSTDIIHVPLPMVSSGEAAKMHSDLILSLQMYGDRDCKPCRNLVSQEVNIFNLNLGEILGKLWLFVAHPILSAVEGVLHEYAHDSLPHITWCATGAFAFLPLHAAGIYGSDEPMKNVDISDFAVSSYTTTLTAMLGLGSKPKQDPTRTPNILVVSQPATPGQEALPGVMKEVEAIQRYASPDHTCYLNHDQATVHAVLDEMSKHEIIHLACHGIQDMRDPLRSAFKLYDEPGLELNTLMGLSLENAELAVLSACQTATGNENLPEEAVHLAAGMLAVGYPSVIATMWSIGDNDPPLIADKVYANILGHRNNSEYQKAKATPAYALHEAVKHLREEIGEMNFMRWVPFVHFGV